jgi:hypothetical protein
MRNEICRLPDGHLEEAEISAMARENAFRMLTNREPIWGYATDREPKIAGIKIPVKLPTVIKLPDYAIRPTLRDFEVGRDGGWCP